RPGRILSLAEWAPNRVRDPDEPREHLERPPGPGPDRGEPRRLPGLDGLRQDALEPLLVDDRALEALGLLELGAGIVARHDVIGLLRDGSRHLPPELLDAGGGLLSRHAAQGSGEDERLPRKRELAVAAGALLLQ